MNIAFQKSSIALRKTRIANLKEGLQNSSGVCKRVVMSSFWDTCNRNPPLGFVSPNGRYRVALTHMVKKLLRVIFAIQTKNVLYDPTLIH